MKPSRASRLASALLLLPSLATSARAQSPLLRDLRGMLPPDVDDARAIVMGDVDGDGDADVVVGTGSINDATLNRLLLNGGNGVFEDVSSLLPPHFDRTRALAMGDVDGDGDLDLIVGNIGADRLYLNDGGGIFTDASAQLPADPAWTEAVALGDVDGDGDLDALLGNWPFEAKRLFLNNGAGTFTDASSQLPGDADPTRDIALGDVDGDGDLDALVANGFDQTSPPDRLYLNDGAGTFVSAPAALPVDGLDTEAVALGDVDGDGDLDALLANGQVGHLGEPTEPLPNRLYLNDGTGTFQDASAQLPAHLDDSVGVVLIDVDGDADLDAVLASGLQGQDRLYLNDGSGTFADATSAMPPDDGQTLSVAAGDVDLDGDPDLVLGCGDFQQDRLYLNDRFGRFTDVTNPFPYDHDDTNEVVVADFDGDGLLDVFAANWLTANRLYLNDGTGPYVDASDRVPVDSEFSTSAAAGDVDGDGDIDILIGNFWNSPNQLLLNDGTGSFIDASSQLPPDEDSTSGVALADVDGDLDLDAYVANSTVEPDRLYLNDGTGHFTRSASMQSIGGQNVDAAFGDLDGDEDADFVVADWGGTNRRYLNDGGGVFLSPPQLLSGPPDDSRDVALGDIDGDGDLDLVVANSFENIDDPQERIYLNDGDGGLVLASGLFPAADDFSREIALGDVDEDDDLDVVVGNAGFLESGEAERLYRNNGDGSLTLDDNGIPALADATLSVKLADLDGDGDLDAVVGNRKGQNRLYFNVTRQVARRGLARVGKTLAMDLFGPPRGSWILARAGAKASLPTALGTLFLDPASLFLVGAGTLDGSGKATLSFLVPSLPALVGKNVYWQAAVSPPFRLTNLEVTTIGAL